jgi:uncharacterized protein with PQ loop repeat
MAKKVLYTTVIMTHQDHLAQQHISKKKRLKLLDKIAIVVAFLYPMSGIPQMWEVMNGSTEGVSLLSWVGFMTFSLFFFIYGIVHKIKPIIITNFLWIVIDAVVVISILVR